ncbi:MAG TPA: VWA domain-containing protein [Verrucomicrobiae bacterium]|nr:VWA domain-containing protein [Verrucomicrobiae bacterium]
MKFFPGRLQVIGTISLALLVPTICNSQDGATQKKETVYQSQTVLRATTRLVVLDVVALDDKGQPISDLKADDFTVLEDGKPQKISDFSYHHPASSNAPARPLAPNIMSNAPQFSANSCMNVILLDAINTDFSSHAYAQDMLIRYLESSPAIQPTAVFALEGKLTMLHDFTTDTKVLRDVVAHFRPQGPEHIPDVYTAASPFQRRGSFKASPRARDVTEHAMLFLARSLGGYPGRKNLIWLSEGFPVSLFPELTAGDQVIVVEDFSPLAERIADALMDAQVALYPIDAAGVSINDRFPARVAMESMAERTGGKTFFNRNDIDTGIRTSIDDGATYYTIEYYPQNRAWDTKFRRIELKLAQGHAQLRYRQGYYALGPTSDNPASATETFSHALDRDAPTSAAVLFQASVLPPSAQTQNKVVVNFGIDPHTVAFQKQSDDLQHANISCVVWAYPAKGDPVRAEGESKAALKEDVYQQMMHSYFPCQRSLALKPGHYTLRLGVLDETTNLIGTLTSQVSVP